MYTKEEKKAATREFWIRTGEYLGKNRSVTGNKVKWLGYRLGLKNCYLRLDADTKSASISIDFQHKDEEIRYLYYEQFTELKVVFTDMVGEFEWFQDFYNEDIEQQISRVTISLDGVDMYNKSDWSKIQKFFEKYLVPIDEFWVEFSEVFKQLEG